MAIHFLWAAIAVAKAAAIDYHKSSVGKKRQFAHKYTKQVLMLIGKLQCFYYYGIYARSELFSFHISSIIACARERKKHFNIPKHLLIKNRKYVYLETLKVGWVWRRKSLKASWSTYLFLMNTNVYKRAIGLLEKNILFIFDAFFGTGEKTSHSILIDFNRWVFWVNYCR